MLDDASGQTQTPHVYSVAELTAQLKVVIEPQFRDIHLEGEISNLRVSQAGHAYFTLKDTAAMIPAVLFANYRRAIAFEPHDGMKVVARGSISIYAKRGSYQLLCTTLQMRGVGEILAMIEERKRHLAAEGLFDSERKRPLPSYPRRVAVVTSPGGAAIRDILQVMGRRNAGIHLVILPTLVQGDVAAASIAAQVRRADMLRLGDVIIVARGGGSLEDLLPFSEEQVVRAIAAVQTPVISAVGHEIDVALSDLVADLRAATPSAAAEIVTADRRKLLEYIDASMREAARTLDDRLQRLRLRLRHYSPVTLAPALRMILQGWQQRFDDTREALLRCMENCLTQRRHRLTVAWRQMQSLSPRSILQRGFAIVERAQDGRPIVDAHQTAIGEHITVRLARSSIVGRVLQTTNDAYATATEETNNVEDDRL